VLIDIKKELEDIVLKCNELNKKIEYAIQNDYADDVDAEDASDGDADAWEDITTIKPKKVVLDKTMKKLIKINKAQPEQRTGPWYELRKKMVTASDVACTLRNIPDVCDAYFKEFMINSRDYYKKYKKGSCCNPYSNKKEFIYKKCNKGKSFTGSIATRWGQKYEPVATEIYEKHNKLQVLEFGLMPHPTLEWLGASPDGITDKNVMLEIKCPFRRKITGIPPFYYWIQVQIQLEVCGLKYCDFLECTIWEYKTEQDFLDDAPSYGDNHELLGQTLYGKDKGIVGTLVDASKTCQISDAQPDDKIEDFDFPLTHYYPFTPRVKLDPPTTIKDIYARITNQFRGVQYYVLEYVYEKNPKTNRVSKVTGRITLADGTIEEIVSTETALYKAKPDILMQACKKYPDKHILVWTWWKLFEDSTVRIKRNKKWFKQNSSEIKRIWDLVLYYRENSGELDTVEDVDPNEDPVSSDDDESSSDEESSSIEPPVLDAMVDL